MISEKYSKHKTIFNTVIILVSLTVFSIIIFLSCHRLKSANNEIAPLPVPSQVDKITSITDDIYNALDCNSLLKVREILSSHPDLGKSKGFCNTVLLKTVWFGDEPDIVKMLLSYGADIGAKDSRGDTPLHLSMKEGHCETSKLLISKGCDINAENYGNETPLHYAAFHLYKNRKEDKEVIELLVKSGANVKARNYSGNTPLHDFAYFPSMINRELTKLLISRGADVNAKNDKQETPLHISIRCNNFDTAEILILNKANVNVKDVYGSTPLDLAIGNGDPFFPWKSKALVDLLVKNGADLPDIHSSAAAGDVKKVAMFVKSNIESVNSLDKGNNTPLHLAAEFNKTDVLLFLVSKKSEINAKNVYGNTPLHTAVMYNSFEAAKFLISKGAKVNIENENHSTPFHEAVERCHIDMVKLLISNGVDVNIKNSYGITPLCIAAQKWDENIVKLLISHGANVNSELKGRWTPLHSAAERGRSKSVDLLLKAHADVNAKDGSGRTPLHYAADGGRMSWSQLSQGHYFDPFRKEQESRSQNFPETLKLLLSSGANVNIRDKNGKTPLDFSASKEISNILLKHGARNGAKE